MFCCTQDPAQSGAWLVCGTLVTGRMIVDVALILESRGTIAFTAANGARLSDALLGGRERRLVKTLQVTNDRQAALAAQNVRQKPGFFAVLKAGDQDQDGLIAGLAPSAQEVRKVLLSPAGRILGEFAITLAQGEANDIAEAQSPAPRLADARLKNFQLVRFLVHAEQSGSRRDEERQAEKDIKAPKRRLARQRDGPRCAKAVLLDESVECLDRLVVSFGQTAANKVRQYSSHSFGICSAKIFHGSSAGLTHTGEWKRRLLVCLQ